MPTTHTMPVPLVGLPPPSAQPPSHEGPPSQPFDLAGLKDALMAAFSAFAETVRAALTQQGQTPVTVNMPPITMPPITLEVAPGAVQVNAPITVEAPPAPNVTVAAAPAPVPFDMVPVRGPDGRIIAVHNVPAKTQ